MGSPEKEGGRGRGSVPRAQRDPWSGTPRDAGAEFSTRMSASDSRTTKTGSCRASVAPANDRLAGTINKHANGNGKQQTRGEACCFNEFVHAASALGEGTKKEKEKKRTEKEEF